MAVASPLHLDCKLVSEGAVVCHLGPARGVAGLVIVTMATASEPVPGILSLVAGWIAPGATRPSTAAEGRGTLLQDMSQDFRSSALPRVRVLARPGARGLGPTKFRKPSWIFIGGILGIGVSPA